MKIVIAIVMFSIIILFHELGHFLLAKKNGVRVNEFCLGLGPTLVGFTRGETKYSIKLLPFGGACMMEGEDGESADTGAFNNKSVWARISVVAAGPFFNFIMAWVFALVIMICVGYDRPVLTGVVEGYPAQEAGIQEGDEIISINGRKIHFYREVSMYSFFHAGEEATIVFERDGERMEATITPVLDEETGSYMYGFIGSQVREKGNVWETFTHSFYEVRYWITYTVDSLKYLVSGKASVNELSGPVGIVKNIGDVYDSSKASGGLYLAFLSMLNMCIFISANLGVMNLLPIPALDGGRLVFLIIEAIRGKRVDPEKEGLVHFVGLMALMALMVFVMFNDIRNIL